MKLSMFQEEFFPKMTDKIIKKKEKGKKKIKLPLLSQLH